MPKYSARTAKALGYLKRSVNDVEIFVEDTSNRNMWVRLLRQALPTTVKLRSINMLGGRRAVLNACALNQSEDGRRKLFIVDGDFDILLGKRKPPLKFLYRLRSYCIENALIERSAIVNIALETHPNMSDKDAEARFDFRSFERDVAEKLKPLFDLYASCNQLCPSVRTVAVPVTELCVRSSDGELVLDDGKISRRAVSVLRSLLRHHPKAKIRTNLQRIRNRSRSIPGLRSVSGKDYLFPLFESRLRIRLSVRSSVEQIKVRLASHFNGTAEPYLFRRIARL